jgi:hypothetical protein
VVRRALAALLVVGALGAPSIGGADAKLTAAQTAHAATASVVSMCKPGYYKNVDSRCVQRPTHAASRPAGASAKCRDGTYSFSLHRSGTCSHHGGVAVWY